MKGIAEKTNVFRAIAKALGIASGYGYKSNELQNRIEDVLCRSGIMLVIDEAHFMFDQRPRMYSRPELIDWVDTALVNERIPVALISTPQFLHCAQQAGEQVNWNWRQFKRRVKRLVVLPEANTDSDLAAVAKQLLPGIGAAGIKLAVNYAKVRKLDISGLADIAEEVRLIANKRNAEVTTFDDLDRAFRENILPSDAAFAKRLVDRSKVGKNPKRQMIEDVRSHASAEPEGNCIEEFPYDRTGQNGYSDVALEHRNTERTTSGV